MARQQAAPAAARTRPSPPHAVNNRRIAGNGSQDRQKHEEHDGRVHRGAEDYQSSELVHAARYYAAAGSTGCGARHTSKALERGRWTAR
jgi:hypothetical protein